MLFDERELVKAGTQKRLVEERKGATRIAAVKGSPAPSQLSQWVGTSCRHGYYF